MSSKTKEIRKKIHELEMKKQRYLTNEEKRQVAKQVVKRINRERKIKAVFLAIGITIGAGGATVAHYALESAKEPKQAVELEQESTTNEFKESLKVDITHTENVQINQDIIQEIVNEYNELTGAQLTKEQIKYIKSNPQFLYENGEGQYIQDYTGEYGTDNVIYDNIGDIYTMIDDQGEIMASIGKIDGQIVDVDTKIVKTEENVTYRDNDGQRIDITKNEDGTEKNQDELKRCYSVVEKAYILQDQDLELEQ